MPTTIKLKRSFTSGNEPAPGDLEVGEVAMNPTDGKVWTKNSAGDIVLLGGLQDGADLPTADPVVVGRLWNDNGTVKVSTG
jgi:DNA-binding beta-propeller fold protein YncE